MATMKSAAEADWADAAVEAVPVTKSGHQIVWQCWIGKIHDTISWADFKPYESLRMEAALSANEKTVSLTQNENVWNIDLALMQQTNLQSGTIRPIRRVVILKQGVLKE